MEKQNHQDKYTTAAYDEAGNRIDIKNARSGANGYFCIGCRATMIAHKPQTIGISPYFRHHPKDVKIHRNCKWSDELTRHKLAQDILQMTKYIKVPDVFKFSPDGIGLGYLIKESEIIRAHTVESEMSFFEDDDYNIQWKHLNINEQTIIKSKNRTLIRPDIAFFDIQGKPILLIEIHSTHKVNEKKTLKINRIGIDTVEVRLPTDSFDSINACFDKTSFTKWKYNHEEQNTTYVPLSNSSRERISSLYDDEEGIYEASFKCRKNQIGNLIRTFEQCLELESYATIERDFKSEMFEIERDTKRYTRRLRELQKRYKTNIEGEFTEEESEFRDRENKFRMEKKRVEELNQREQEKITTETGNLETATELLIQSIREIKAIIGNQQEEIRRLELSVNDTVSF